jgi:hypothetical protein
LGGMDLRGSVDVHDSSPPAADAARKRSDILAPILACSRALLTI